MNKKFLFIILSILIFIFGGIYYFSQKGKIQIHQEKLKEIFEMINKEKLKPEKFQFGSYPVLEKENFFEKIKEKLLEEKIDFLLVDLSKKELFYFKEEKLKRKYQILAFGKEGSFWETPVGFYQIESKNKKAFSSIGRVWMPYFLQFQGNFSLHGWPYYPNGKAVSSEFSGGCIRLSTNDAKEIFQEVKIDTPILIVEESFFPDDFVYQEKIPEIKGEIYLAADLKNNFLFLEKNSEKLTSINSLTKLMTALITTEYINLWRRIKIQESDLRETALPRLRAGQTFNGFDLLYLLLGESSNEVAEVFSRFLGKDRFLNLMNKKAKSLGLEKTEFKDYLGESKESVSTAKDLFFLAKYLFHNRKFLLDISRGKIYRHLISKKFNDLQNFNCFSQKENFIGGKVGKNSALSIFEIDFGKEKRPIVILVLNSSVACQDVEKILNWIKNNFQEKK